MQPGQGWQTVAVKAEGITGNGNASRVRKGDSMKCIAELYAFARELSPLHFCFLFSRSMLSSSLRVYRYGGEIYPFLQGGGTC